MRPAPAVRSTLMLLVHWSQRTQRNGMAPTANPINAVALNR